MCREARKLGVVRDMGSDEWVWYTYIVKSRCNSRVVVWTQRPECVGRHEGGRCAFMANGGLGSNVFS